MAASKKTVSPNETVNEAQSFVNSTLNTATDTIGGFIGNASRIVLKAADILEEEIAKGILAARQVEDKFADVPKLRGGQITDNQNFDELIVRFRKDAHDIIDLVVDFASIAAQNAGKLSAQFIKIGAIKTADSNTSNAQVPLIQLPKELHAGEQTELPVTLENDNATEEKNIAFISSPLTDSSGNQLPSGSLSFNPNPLKIPAQSKATVNVKISIPATAKPGSYTSFIQAQNMDILKATLLVKVIS